MTPGFYLLHPWLNGSGRGERPNGSGAHNAWRAPESDPLDTGRLRYIPPPSGLLLHTLHGWMQAYGEQLEGIPPERRGLLLDAYGAFDGVREEYSRPLRAAPPEMVSPLLFPHTSEMSAAAMAAILFDLKGPVICVHPLCPCEVGGGVPALLEEGRILLEGGLCDVILVAALCFTPMPLGEETVAETAAAHGFPVVDCGVALALDHNEEYKRRVPRDVVRRQAGFTGVCEPLLECVLHD
ncbi:MAG: hypothetical protein PHG65_12165 [Kiritimatiellae bacterium]|nr:hypothetical protein [Kiritimatiellia bacterium]